MDENENWREKALEFAMDYAKLRIGEPSPEGIVEVARVFEAFLNGEREKVEVPPIHKHPAVPIDESLKIDGIICLEDGKAFQMMKRHLRVEHGMTPEEYRDKWGLPADYPMVASMYSLRRSDIAKERGLGRRAKAAE